MARFTLKKRECKIMEIRNVVGNALIFIIAGLLAWAVWGRRKQIDAGNLPDIELYIQRIKSRPLKVFTEGESAAT